MRALQDNGLSLGQTKMRDQQNLPTPPISPRHSAPIMGHSTSTSGYSAHALVPASTLGPPSPTSTPSSSPPNSSLMGSFDLTGFNQAFPSIDELDEGPVLSFPSVPTGIGSTSKPPPVQPSYGRDTRNVPTDFRSFTIPIERPSSVPIMNNGIVSRPASPNGSSNASRTSNAPHRPSGLSNGLSTGPPSAPKVPIPVKNTAFPKDLLTYIRDHNVLLIDVRNRAEFDREHIKGTAVVCIEPSVLMREGYVHLL